MSSDPRDRVPGALVVWNPLIEPDTIVVHVDHWRASGRGDDRRTWWGRIYDAPADRMPRPELVAALEESLGACRESLDARGRVVLFATDFRQLHALEVDDVRSTLRDPEQAPPPEERPAYYHARRVIAWFRVRDVRALSFEPIDTLQYLREHVRVRRTSYGYDPYASFGLRYPAFVCGPAPEALFDEPRARLGISRFADLADTIYPPRLALARGELQRLLGDTTWNGLDDASRLWLASARILVTQGHALDAQLEMTPVVMYLSNVLERELVGGVVQPVAAALGTGSPRLEQVDQLRRAWDGFEIAPRPLTLGAVAMMVPAMRSWQPARHGFGPLVCDDAWARWLSQFVGRRNDAAHARQVDRAWVEAAARQMFGEQRHPAIGVPLHTVVHAKGAVRNLIARSASAP